jgi:membrane protein YqaA with SNARE-associated domain
MPHLDGRVKSTRVPLGDRLVALADRPLGFAILVILALLEATVFPGPTEAMLVALTLGRRERVVWFAAVAIAASVIGGLAGYFLGATLFAELVQPLLASYGLTAHVDTVARVYADNMLLALGTSGYTPIPYMLYTAMAGVAELPLPTFVFGSILGRTLKYVPIALLAYVLGPRVHWALRRFGSIAAALLIVAVGIWLLV